MGHKLRTIEFEDGRRLYEKACEHYKCGSCGCSMISCNFVNGIGIQVFASHHENCRTYIGSAFARTVEVTCDSCKYYDEERSCIYGGEEDARINSVRTGCRAADVSAQPDVPRAANA